MNISEAVALVLLCFYAAAGDIFTRTIPDWLPITIVAIGILLRFRSGLIPLAESLAGAGVLFMLLFLAYTRHAIGGGDVKLAAALAVGLPPLVIIDFVVATVLLGGVIGLFYALLRLRISHPAGRRRSLLVRVAAIECWRARRQNSVPYGVAIAAGATVVLLPKLTPVFTALHA